MDEGGCYCGSIRYKIEGEPLNQAICHCRDCQKSAGASSVAWIMMAEDGFAVTKGSLKCREGKNGAERYFCGDCGTAILYKNATILPGMVDLTTVTLDEPEKFVPEMHIQLADQIGWEKTIHELPGFDGFPPQE